MTSTTEGTLTQAQRDGILRALGELQAAEGMTNTFVARSVLRCSPAVYSQLRRGTYRGNVDLYLLRARQWMADRQSRAETPDAPYVDTAVGRTIMAVCHRAWSMPCIGQVITPSGAGKTAALREFARRRGDRALYIQAGEAYSMRGGLLLELARRLKLAVTTRSYSPQLYSQVRDRLADYYGGGKSDPFCLLVDEATTLRPQAINILRNLHDDPGCRAAVVLADTWRLHAELHGRSGMAGGYEQLRSRFGAVYAQPLDREISIKDVRAIVRSVLESLGFDARPDAHSLRYLHRLAQRDGKLRNVVHRLWAVRDVAESAGVEPSYSVAELDYVATIVGHECELDHHAPPFGPSASGAEQQKKTA